MDSRHGGKTIVGWYHSHPGFGVFLSDRDRFIHLSFFNSPHQIALVYDPQSREHGVFTWRENEVTRTRQYWIGDREQLWGEPPPGTGVSLGPDDLPAPEKPVAEETEAGRREPELATWAMVAVFFLILGGLVGWYVGRGSSSDAVDQANLKLDKARVAGALDAARMLNTEMLGFLRGALDGDPVRDEVRTALGDLRAGIAALEKEESSPEAAERLKQGAERLEKVLDLQDRTRVALTRLERLSRLAQIDPREVVRALSQQSSALGQLYAELATDAESRGERKRALRLLRTAAAVNPANAERYESRIRALEEEEPR
jgi:hypothetical protein